MPTNERPRTKYSSYLADAHFKRWLCNLARVSPITAEVALRRLGKLCEFSGLRPNEMVTNARKDLAGFQDMLEFQRHKQRTQGGVFFVGAAHFISPFCNPLGASL